MGIVERPTSYRPLNRTHKQEVVLKDEGELTPELPTRDQVTMADRKSETNKPKTTKELDVPGLKVIEPINDRFASAVDCRNYRIIKSSSRNDNDQAHKLHKIVEKIAMEMKDRFFSKKTLCRQLRFTRF